MSDMPLSYLEHIKPKSKLAVWAWSPVIVLRIALVGVYILGIYAAAIAFIAGVPLFTLVAWEGYTSIWATVLGISSLLCAIGSITERWRQLERWASLALSGSLLGYAIGMNLVAFVEGDLNRQFVGAIALMVSVLPVTRFVYLAAQVGKKHVRVRS